ncbi:hypothetical protein HHK36_006922 [Tetracentron sinense]|uniref:Calmodulin-binding protein n=1 Tax=Tetracentron sinense TaxID=13715 RepID=A0A834ZIV6_TETSI|nr:hypothetical protein HHK36_006922 [Tetracentron sinense]
MLGVVEEGGGECTKGGGGRQSVEEVLSEGGAGEVVAELLPAGGKGAAKGGTGARGAEWGPAGNVGTGLGRPWTVDRLGSSKMERWVSEESGDTWEGGAGGDEWKNNPDNVMSCVRGDEDVIAKRLLDQSGSDEDQPDEKRMRTRPSLAAIIREVVMMKSLENFLSTMEPLLRRVVTEEVERGLRRGARSFSRSPSLRIQALEEPPTIQLIFSKKLSLPVFTGSKIEDIDGHPLQILLVDTRNNPIVPTSLAYPIRVEIVVLDGDFPPEDRDDWSSNEFDSKIVRERTGKRPLLTGDVSVTVRDGFTLVGDLTFTDNSSWIRSRNFRLGARVVQGNCEGVRIREAITEPFVVKDHRGELYKKHYPPSLDDDVWRLEKIGKDGAFHKKLAAEAINKVKDFLKLWVVDPTRLRRILGGGMSDKTWEATTKHAATCILGNKKYMFHGPCYTIIVNPIYQVVGATLNGQTYTARDLNGVNRAYVENLVRDAYIQQKSLEDVDELLNENALLPPGNPAGEYPNHHQNMVGSSKQYGLLTSGSVDASSPPTNTHREYSDWVQNPTNPSAAIEIGNGYNISDSSSDSDSTPLRFFSWSPSLGIQALEAPTLQLFFSSKNLSVPVFTGSKIEDRDGQPLQILLVDTRDGQMVQTTLPYGIRVEIVVLDGDFPPIYSDDWTSKEFDNNIVQERKGKRPLLTGDVLLTVRDSFTLIGDLTFTDNSSWTRSRRFRLGARVAQGSCESVRVREAMTEPFVVKDQRGGGYKKHHPPLLGDNVWRLEKIGRDGVFHKKLAAEAINTVQDFLKQWVVDSTRLRNILGLGMFDKTWEATMKHARTCNIGSKKYKLCGPCYTIFVNPIWQVVGVMLNGQTYPERDLTEATKVYVENLVRDAYIQRKSLEEVDELLNENALLPPGIFKSLLYVLFILGYKKHHPPLLDDDVWRLERIGRDGVFHKKLAAVAINTVQDFLKQWVVDSTRLRNILGLGMLDKTWEATMKHARTCIIGSKKYKLCGPCYTIFVNPVRQVVGVMLNGQTCPERDLTEANRVYVENLVRDAYIQRKSLEEFDEPLNENALLPPGDPVGEYPNHHQDIVGLTSGSVGAASLSNNSQGEYSDWELNPTYPSATTGSGSVYTISDGYNISYGSTFQMAMPFRMHHRPALSTKSQSFFDVVVDDWSRLQGPLLQSFTPSL